MHEYARRRTLERIAEKFSAARLPPFSWRDYLTPNDLDGKASVRIGDTAPVVRLEDGGLKSATGQVTSESLRCPLQVGRATMRASPTAAESGAGDSSQRKLG